MSSMIGVAQLNRYIALRLKNDVKLTGLAVRGEIGDLKVHFKSGHAYFALKEDGSQIRCVMFRGQFSRLRFKPENGMRVVCAGNIEVYEPNGVYQIIVSEILPLGVGEQFLRIEAIKEKLSRLGYFAAERKKPLPALPKRIAVVTSESGAALQDVLNILGRRYPVGEVTVFPAQVQGEAAHLTITEALKKADGSGADVIILTRGGGSYEDLMPFNTEEVATAVALCITPVISAVGHETDTTLADYAADVRAPTPSAAAEICAPETGQLLDSLDSRMRMIAAGFEGILSRWETRLSEMNAELVRLSPNGRLDRESERLERLVPRMNAAFSAKLDREGKHLGENVLRADKAFEKLIDERQSNTERLSAALEALDPYKVLERGYTITMKNGSPVSSAELVDIDDELTIRFRDREIKVRVTGIV